MTPPKVTRRVLAVESTALFDNFNTTKGTYEQTKKRD